MQVFDSRSLKHTYTHMSNFFLITLVTAAQPPVITTPREIMSFIRRTMTYFYWVVICMKPSYATTNTCIFIYHYAWSRTRIWNPSACEWLMVDGWEGWFDGGEKRHACDREVTMKSRQNEKSNWKTTGRVENSFSKLQRWSLVQIMAFSLQIRAWEGKCGKWQCKSTLTTNPTQLMGS